MASPAKIVEELPDILPEDFGEWDDERSSSTRPVRLAGSENGLGAVVVAMPLTQPIKPYGAAAASGNPLPGTALPNPAPRPAAVKAPAGRVERKPTRRKWPVLAGASAALVILAAAAIPALNHKRASTVEAVASPEPKETQTAQPESAALKPVLSTFAAPAPAQLPEASDNWNAAAPSNPEIAAPWRAAVQLMNVQLNAPARIHMAAAPAEQAPPPSGGFAAAGMDGLVNDVAIGRVFSGAKQPSVQVASPKIVDLSASVAFGLLIQKTPPIYPQVAKESHTAGTIVLHARVSKSGTIEDLRVVSGPEMLRQAALNAVRTWRYKPYKMNHQPMEFETTISVDFALGS